MSNKVFGTIIRYNRFGKWSKVLQKIKKYKKNKKTKKKEKKYYSKNKNFNKLNSAEFELKNGKATISLKKLKKLKKKKTYYVKVVGVLKQELYGKEMVNYTRISKTMKIKNKVN